jgi:hypothetical protein
MWKGLTDQKTSLSQTCGYDWVFHSDHKLEQGFTRYNLGIGGSNALTDMTFHVLTTTFHMFLSGCNDFSQFLQDTVIFYNLYPRLF